MMGPRYLKALLLSQCTGVSPLFHERGLAPLFHPNLRAMGPPLYLGEKEAQNRRRLQAYFRPFSIRIPTRTCQSFTAIYATFSMSSFINCANLKLSQILHRSDSEPTLATLSQGANNNNRRPSIAITRASVERLAAI